jgi:hypothetical protein
MSGLGDTPYFHPLTGADVPTVLIGVTTGENYGKRERAVACNL